MDMREQLLQLTYDQRMAIYYLAGANEETRELIISLAKSWPDVAEHIHHMNVVYRKDSDLANRINEYARILGRRPYDEEYEVEYTIKYVGRTFSAMYIEYTTTVFWENAALVDVECRIESTYSNMSEFSIIVKQMDKELRKMWGSTSVSISFPCIKNNFANCTKDPTDVANATARLLRDKAPHKDRSGTVALAVLKSIDGLREHAKIKDVTMTYILRLADIYELFNKQFDKVDGGIMLRHLWSNARPIMLVKNNMGEYYKVTSRKHDIYKKYRLMFEMMKT